MKRKIWIIITACVAVLVIAAACLLGFAARRGIRFSQAQYLETEHGHMVLIDGIPISMSGKDSLFQDLTTGDRVLVAHDLIAESYPGQSRAYLCFKQADGTEEDIPADVLALLRDMGWLPEEEPASQVDPRPLYEDEVIGQAKKQISWEYYAVTAEQNPETGEWTVTFWSQDRETFQVVIVDRYGGILQVTEGIHWAENP